MNTTTSSNYGQTAALIRFATGMRRIPRKALRCEVYGTVSVVVDRAHAINIFRKLFPATNAQEHYIALMLLQDRLDSASTF